MAATISHLIFTPILYSFLNISAVSQLAKKMLSIIVQVP